MMINMTTMIKRKISNIFSLSRIRRYYYYAITGFKVILTPERHFCVRKEEWMQDYMELYIYPACHSHFPVLSALSRSVSLTRPLVPSLFLALSLNT